LPKNLLGKIPRYKRSEPQPEAQPMSNAVAFIQNESGFDILLSINPNSTDENLITYLLTCVKEEFYRATFDVLIQRRPHCANLIEKILEELDGPIIPADKANLL